MASIINIANLHIMQHNVRNYHMNKELLHSDWDDEDADIIMLNSTCINPNSNYSLNYRDYKVYNTPSGFHNGSAILVKRQLKHSRTNTGDDQLIAVTNGTPGDSSHWPLFTGHLTKINQIAKFHTCYLTSCSIRVTW